MSRTARIERKTAETQIELTLEIDGTGRSEIGTGVGFLDHMLTLLAKHAAIDLTVKAEGDLHVDQHHTVEDVGICLGAALREALGDKAGIRVTAISRCPWKRPWSPRPWISAAGLFVFQAEFPSAKIGDFDSELVADFWQAFAANALANLHVVAAPRPQQPPHRRGDLQVRRPRPADVRRPRLPHHRRAQHQGHANVGLEQATDLWSAATCRRLSGVFTTRRYTTDHLKYVSRSLPAAQESGDESPHSKTPRVAS